MVVLSVQPFVLCGMVYYGSRHYAYGGLNEETLTTRHGNVRSALYDHCVCLQFFREILNSSVDMLVSGETLDNVRTLSSSCGVGNFVAVCNLCSFQTPYRYARHVQNN